MRSEKHNTKLNGEDAVVEVTHFDKKDAQELKKIFDDWAKANKRITKYGRRINIPEVVSEGMFCLFSGSVRYRRKIKGKGSASFDTINLKTNAREQIKACSIEQDLSSFGPKTEWDKLYFMNFYNNGNLDGTFDVYEIPNKLIYKNKVNKGQTMKDQQKEKRRPRFSFMKDIIKPNNLKPVGKNIQVWKL